MSAQPDNRRVSTHGREFLTGPMAWEENKKILLLHRNDYLCYGIGMTHSASAIEHHFLKHGWVVLTLPDPRPIYRCREQLQKKLRSLIKNRSVTLELYHRVMTDDTQHIYTQKCMSDFFHENHMARSIVGKNKEIFEILLGKDLNLQRAPYLRMTRPHKPQDNIGFHRDTHYGGSPYEISCLIPFVALSKGSALSVLSGSHIRPESDFPFVQTTSPDIVKGSVKHKLGFPYAPKVMDMKPLKQLQPVPLKLGQVLVFSLSTVHGSVENTGTHSRWSSDMRIVNPFAPVDLSKRPDYYESLSLSPVSAQAQQYLAANVRDQEEVAAI